MSASEHRAGADSPTAVVASASEPTQRARPKIKHLMTEQPLVNRVAQSGLVTLDLEQFYPAAEPAIFDLKDYLFMEMILKEKDFRADVAEHDWTQYEGKTLLVYCSADAIIPMWAYMLVAVSAAPFATEIVQGDLDFYLRLQYDRLISNLDVEMYRDQRVVVKGCSTKPVPAYAYAAITAKLAPVVKSIMFGEPCSTVPIYRR